MTSFIALGLIALMTWSLQRFASSFASLMAPWRRKKISFGRAFLDPSSMSNQVQALAFQGLRLRTWKENLSWMSFAGISIWSAIFVGVLFLQVNALALLAVGAVALLIPISQRLWNGIAMLFLFLGLALFAGENAVRFSAMMFDQETNFLLGFLADGRLAAVIVWFLVGAILGVLLQVEFFCFSLAIVLVATGMMSISGAAALWFGERVGWTLRLWWNARKLSTSTRKLTSIKAVVTGGASLVAVFGLGFARDLIGPIGSMGIEGLSERVGFFLWLSLFCEMFPLLLGWVVTRTRFGATPEDLFESKYPTKHFFSPLGARPWVLQELSEGILRRKGELQALQKDFAAMDWQKVPPAIRQASEKEVQSLDEVNADVQALLLSRSSFFSEQLR